MSSPSMTFQSALYLDTFPLLLSSLSKMDPNNLLVTNSTLYSLKYKFGGNHLLPSFGFQKYDTVLVLLQSLQLYVGCFYTMTKDIV